MRAALELQSLRGEVVKMAIDQDNVRQEVQTVVFALLDSNKPTGWTVVSAIPNSDSAFPVMIVHPVETSQIKTNMDGSRISREIRVRIELMTHYKQGKRQIDVGRDNVETTIIDNVESLYTTSNQHLEFLELEDNGSEDEEHNDQLYNTALFTLRLKL